MNAATRLTPRLERVLIVLLECGVIGATTRDIVVEADVCAVNSCVAELRTLGHKITCTMEGRGLFRYRLNG